MRRRVILCLTFKLTGLRDFSRKESSYEKVDTVWLAALGFELDRRAIAER